MKLRNFLLIFAVGILFGALMVAIFGGGHSDPPPAPSNDTDPEIAVSPEPPPLEIAHERQAPRPVVPAPTVPDANLPETPEQERTRPADRVSGVKPWLDQAKEDHTFDAAHLEASGCLSADAIAWIRLRWEEFEVARRALVDRATRGELSSDGAEWSDLQQELRDNLGEEHYGGLLYATRQSSGIRLNAVPRGSHAADAGLRSGDRVLRYDGARVYTPTELADLVLGEFFKRHVEIEVRRGNDTIESVLIEPGPLGALLNEWLEPPCPEADVSRVGRGMRGPRGGGKRLRDQMEQDLESEDEM